MRASDERVDTAVPSASKRGEVDAQYTAPVGPDMAVDAVWNAINFGVRGWGWLRTPGRPRCYVVCTAERVGRVSATASRTARATAEFWRDRAGSGRGSTIRRVVRGRRAWILGGAAVVPVLMTVACSGGSTASDSSTIEADAVVSTSALVGVGVDVRRDPGCGCCTSWVEYLRTHGADVKVREDSNRQTFQEQSGVPTDGESCHTAIVDGYVVEGHVPAEAIARLLAHRPEGKGLALGGMPSDAPGMGGDESTWSEQAVMFISADGGLSPFEY